MTKRSDGMEITSTDLLERCFCPRCGGPGGASKPPRFGDYPVADGVWLSCPRCAIWWAVSVGGKTGESESSNDKAHFSEVSDSERRIK